MSRFITFSRTYPNYHPRAGDPTFFVEKIHNAFTKLDIQIPEADDLPDGLDAGMYLECDPKWHTIRSGHRFKVGDWFSPRVWSGRPYHSKQIVIGPDIQIPKIWNFVMNPSLWFDECMFELNNKIIKAEQLKIIARNDGLDAGDFISWFAGSGLASSKRKPFDGQIICWNENIEY